MSVLKAWVEIIREWERKTFCRLHAHIFSRYLFNFQQKHRKSKKRDCDEAWLSFPHHQFEILIFNLNEIIQAWNLKKNKKKTYPNYFMITHNFSRAINKKGNCKNCHNYAKHNEDNSYVIRLLLLPILLIKRKWYML